jgi:hypothetical protein
MLGDEAEDGSRIGGVLMRRLKGTVRNNVIVLEEGIRLPDDTEVEIYVPLNPEQRAKAFRRVRRNPITRYIGIDEIIEQDKQEREERWEGGDLGGP